MALFFGLALTIRVIYLIQSADTPRFLHPTVDAGTYHQLAKDLATGKSVGNRLFWQPYFYPNVLAAIYRIFGPSIWAAKIIQAFIGAFTCVLLYCVGRLSLSRREGLIAAGIVAFYGPLVFVEVELLATGWAMFWVTTIFLLMGALRRLDNLLLYIGLGLAGALGVFTRPPLLIFFFVALSVQAVVLFRTQSMHQALTRLLLVLIAFALPALYVALQNEKLTGHFGILPSSAGINLYLGNNPEWKTTVTARPGVEWHRIYTMPFKHGHTNTWAASRYFREQVYTYVRESPYLFLKGIVEKTVRFFNSRELPRNIDIYVHRQWSWLLSAMTWKAGSFGFPFGILLPLAFIGLWRQAKIIPFYIWCFLGTYPFSIILYFVTGRYRILIVPALALSAATGTAYLWDQFKCHRHKKILTTLLTAVLLAVLTTLPSEFQEERRPYEAEMYWGIGQSHLNRGEFEEALPFLEQSLALAPNFLNSLNDMTRLQNELGRTEQALEYVTRGLRAHPDSALMYYNQGLIFMIKEDYEQAERAFKKTVELDPDMEVANFNLGVCMARRDRFKDAVRYFQEELRVNPRFKEAEEYLTQALAASAMQDQNIPLP